MCTLKIYKLFQILLNKISGPPEEESQLLSWNNRLEDDMEMVQSQDNTNQSIPHEPQYHFIFAGCSSREALFCIVFLLLVVVLVFSE
ncbi:hypothetical protein Bca4012_027239 [Brassica carinata]|uniref:Uncharacterized protein n=1 Tax=Brassica carinata TaxID=52824 RepID=A0A8X7VK34_BRACI|nr:hypothetical protein Bca52824_024236 [Brassica carinata]